MSKRQLGALAALVGVIAFVAAGCGGSNEEAGATEGAKTACKATATTAATGLPAAFPVPGELTFTSVRKDGPSIVIDGYWTADLDEAYEEFKDEVERGGYTVLFTEKEEDDAEISYKGSGRTGQIALRGDCEEGDTTRIHITNRPE
jgi:ABC-type glycerol-3-phosphate transport system substrate-binding protein